MSKFRINKSLLEPEELAAYNAILAKAAEAVEDIDEDEDEEFPVKPKKKAEENPMAKSAASPELTAALAEMQELKKSIEMKEFTEIAKKYAPLGKKEDELAKTLYDLKKSDEANYNAFVSVLDESLDLVEKSGIFTEIGKSAGSAPAGAEAKAVAKAQEIMKADPTMTYNAAIAKAWEDPAIMAEYDAEYRA